MASRKETKKAHVKRQRMDDAYEAYNIEPTDGYRSRLEALWVAELEACDSFHCVECVQVPLWIVGPYGEFLSSYTPDIVLDTPSGRIFVELKPTTELAMEDDRQKRALKLNPRYKFLVLGGYPYNRYITVRMLTGTSEKVVKEASVCQILELLGCQCPEENVV